MKHGLKILLMSLVGLFPIILAKKKEHTAQHSWSDWYYIAKSGSTFHASLFYNKVKYGNEGLFHVICSPSAKVSVERNAAGIITDICDGKKSPLLLGGIPSGKKSLKAIRMRLSLHKNERIELYTLNQDFECRWSGLKKLVKKNKDLITQFLYPTIDHTAPTLENIIKAVDTLNTRDERNAFAAYVHCKAGRGRSATIVAAYLIVLAQRLGVHITIDEIEKFMQSKRPQVRMSKPQRLRLVEFKEALQQAGTFEKLKEKFLH